MSDRERSSAPLGWWVTPGLQPFWYAYLAFSWWQVGASEAGREGAAPSAGWLSQAAWLVPAGKFTVFLLEAAFYHLAWRGSGRRLPFWRFFCVVASASLADVLAASLAGLARDGTQTLALWVAPLAGLHVAGDSALGSSTALRAGFGTVGLLTAIRIGLTSYAQARALDLRWRITAGGTALVWLMGRVAIWWAVDLARGVSPLPGR